ncbi:MAG: L,D-transpeptidase family protein [Alphaproteobacteria bacterium]
MPMPRLYAQEWSFHQSEIDDFYAKRAGRSLWIKDRKLNSAGIQLWRALSESWQHGLNPKNYHTNEISYILSHTQYKNSADPDLSLKLELLLTDGYIRYARDLSGMRIRASALGLDEQDWQQRKSVKYVLSRLFESADNTKQLLQALEPQTATYQHLKQEMHNVFQAQQSDDKERKIAQIIVNMERLRWVADEKPQRFIVVNIPSEQLWAIENKKVRISMPVAVGSKKRPTRPFVTQIRGVRFNPAWTIPDTIKREDIWPQLRQNARYLEDKGVELFSGYGANALTLDPSAIDWKGISKQELASLRMVQVPGNHNPLGQIRLLMPNRYGIYLHDTNDKSVFARDERDVSSGCIRMSEPEKMAGFVLQHTQSWTKQQSVSSALKTKQTRDVYAIESAKLYLVYYTIWLGEKQQIIYGSDIYGRDERLLRELEKLDALPPLKG